MSNSLLTLKNSMEYIDSYKLANAVLNNLVEIRKRMESLFYLKCIDYIKSHIKKFSKTHRLSNLKIIEPLRLYLYSNYDNYVCMLIDIEPEKLLDLKPYIVYNIQHMYSNEEIARSNMLRQLWALETNNLNNLKTPIENLDLSYRQLNPTFILSPISNIDKLSEYLTTNKTKHIKIQNKASLNLFLCDHTYRFLKHQNLDRFCWYMSIADNEIKKPSYMPKKRVNVIKTSVQLFKRVYEFYKKIEHDDLDMYRRLLLFNDFVLYTLGTEITTDADTMFLTYKMDRLHLKKCKKLLNEQDTMEYFTYDTKPNLEDVENLITDPSKHYYFMGIKIISFNYYIDRLKRNASCASFANTIMLKNINKLNVQICYPLFTLKEQTVVYDVYDVYDSKAINYYIHLLKQYFKESHGINYTLNNLRSIMKPCINTSLNYPRRNKNKITYLIEQNIQRIILELSVNNFIDTVKNIDNDVNYNNIESWIVVDDGLKYPVFDTQNKLKKIIVTVPTEEPKTKKIIEIYQSESDKNKSSGIIDCTIMPVNYNDEWGTNVIDILKGVHISGIILHYTAKYIERPNFITSLLKLTSIGSKIIIIRVDDDKIKSILKHDISKLFTSSVHNKLYAGVFQFDNDCLFYLRGSDRYNTGRVESLTDPIEILESNGFRRIKTQNMNDYFLKNKHDKYLDASHIKDIIDVDNDAEYNKDRIMKHFIEDCQHFVMYLFKYDIYIRVK